MLKKIDEKLFLIGVAHVLPTSMTEVKEIIKKERPDIVAVELCPMRYLALTQGEKRAGILDVMRAGPSLLTLTFLLNLLQNKFSHQTGMPAGEEMLTAINYAKEVGARVELIDRDIRLTLQRLVNRMSWRERLRLFGDLLVGILLPGKQIQLEKLTDEEIVNYIIEEIKRTSPVLYEVLIKERDDYMASRLLSLLQEGKKVVCVVGAGHVPGIFNHLSRQEKIWEIKIEYGVGS